MSRGVHDWLHRTDRGRAYAKLILMSTERGLSSAHHTTPLHSTATHRTKGGSAHTKRVIRRNCYRITGRCVLLFSIGTRNAESRRLNRLFPSMTSNHKPFCTLRRAPYGPYLIPLSVLKSSSDVPMMTLPTLSMHGRTCTYSTVFYISDFPRLDKRNDLPILFPRVSVSQDGDALPRRRNWHVRISPLIPLTCLSENCASQLFFRVSSFCL